MPLSDVLSYARKLFTKDPPVGSVAELADFLDRHTSFMAQKCVIEFCRVRAGIYWQKLFEEEEFKDKLHQSCWESFTPVLAMILEVVDADLREAAGLRQRQLPAALEAVARQVIARHPVPQGAPAEFWDREFELIAERMKVITGEPARPIEKMAAPMARKVFERLPIHKDIVQHDYDYIRNNLRMNLVRTHEDFLALARPDELVAELLGEAEA
ncbi:MAG TPA: hypothetical protein VLQ68_09590 [Rhizobiaceae bacterium]|nr:hypothetical protein [Rhizobiaceae bacterium]